jgi:hypothetical protein
MISAGTFQWNRERPVISPLPGLTFIRGIPSAYALG